MIVEYAEHRHCRPHTDARARQLRVEAGRALLARRARARASGIRMPPLKSMDMPSVVAALEADEAADRARFVLRAHLALL